MRQGVIRLAGVAAAVALMTAAPGTAGAATSAWAFQTFPLPAGAAGAEGDSVSCLTATDCAAASIAYGPRTPTVEWWNGSGWTAQELPLPPDQNFAQVNEISCASASSCMTTGEYTESEGNQVMFAEHWDGAAWTPLAVSPPAGATGGTLRGVSCGSATSCFAVGNYFGDSPAIQGPLAEHWNGTKWAPQTVPLPAGATGGFLRAVSCTSGRSCMAVGFWDGSTTGTETPLAEQWDGSTWTLLAAQPAPSALGFFGAVSCRSASSCTAAGGYGETTKSELPLAEQWDGSTWTPRTVPVPSGAQAAELTGVSCPTATRCTATGWYNKGPGNAALGEGWNGSAWAVQHMAQPPARQTPAAISCVAARTCEMVGQQVDTNSNTIQALAEGE